MNKRKVLAVAAWLALAVASSNVALAQVVKPVEVVKSLGQAPTTGPDLMCDIMISDDQSGANATVPGEYSALGSPLWIHFTVRNQGSDKAEGFVSSVKVQRIKPGGFGQSDVPTTVHKEEPTQPPLSLGPGQSVRLPAVRVDLDPGTEPLISAEMYPDHGDAIPERDEFNRCSARFNAQAPKPERRPVAQAVPGAELDADPDADPDPSKLMVPKELITANMPDLSCTVYGWKQWKQIPHGAEVNVSDKYVDLKITLRNTGKTLAGFFATATVQNLSEGETKEHKTGVTLGPGFSYTWRIDASIGAGMGNYRNNIRATAWSDRANEVPEANETNNECGTEFVAWYSPGAYGWDLD